MKKILITNDDGIDANGIVRLANVLRKYGEVTVVAPAKQCSAMSHRITLGTPMRTKKVNFPVENVNAYSVEGTPADCIKVALGYLLKETPDMIFSGINFGTNTGFDIAYSGTVSAAMEGLLNGIFSVAVSTEVRRSGEDVSSWKEPSCEEANLESIISSIMDMPCEKNEIWNINFPELPASRCKGIIWGKPPAKLQYFKDQIIATTLEDGSFGLMQNGIRSKEVPKDTDLAAVVDGYISVSKVKNLLLS